MINVAVMIEGQDGVNWPRWKRIAEVVDKTGFAGLYRSDHFTNPRGPHKDALELWTSLTYLASQTKNIQFGPLVSPVSFRDPVTTAWVASAVDDLSGGRLRLGLGAGWQEREHHDFGYDLLPTLKKRFQRFEEGLEVISHLLRDDEPTTFTGEYYKLDGALLMPRPARKGGPPIVIGGKGPLRTLPLVAKFADEWNAVGGQTPATFPELNQRLKDLLKEAGRDDASVHRSLMTTVIFGRTQADVDAQAQAEGKTPAELIAAGRVVGTGDAIVDQIKEWEAAGLQTIMLRWADLDDMAGLEALGKSILHRV